MDDKDDHWDEILQMAKSKYHEGVTPVTELDAGRSDNMDKNVYLYIDQQFSPKDEAVARENTNTVSDSEGDRAGNGIWARLSAAGRRLIPESLPTRAVPVMACALVAVVAISLLTRTDQSEQPFFDVPDSVFTAGLDTHIQLSRGDSRALVSQTTSRHGAFLSGNIRAELDVFESSDNVEKLILERLPIDGTHEGSSESSQQRLGDFAAQLETMMADDRAKRWLKEGCMIELIQLAAKDALVELETGTLNDVIRYFRDQTDLAGWLSSETGDGLNPKYLTERVKLYGFNFDNTATPDEIQQIVDITSALKVLVN